MFKRNALVATTITLAAAACGQSPDIVETQRLAGVPGAGPGTNSLYTTEWPFEAAPITEGITVPVECEPGDTTLYIAACPFERAAPAFDPATGPGSNSLSMGG